MGPRNKVRREPAPGRDWVLTVEGVRQMPRLFHLEVGLVYTHGKAKQERCSVDPGPQGGWQCGCPWPGSVPLLMLCPSWQRLRR